MNTLKIILIIIAILAVVMSVTVTGISQIYLVALGCFLLILARMLQASEKKEMDLKMFEVLRDLLKE